MPWIHDDIVLERVSSEFTKIVLYNQIIVLFDGQDRITIKVPADLESGTRGVCGVFDDQEDNDFTTPEGDVETSPIDFAQSWQIGTCSEDAPTQITKDQCAIFADRADEAKALCGVFLNEDFQKCHAEVNIERVYQSCLSAYCRTANQESVCTLLSAYAMECAQSGIILESWRENADICQVSCPAGQVWQECGSACRQSCGTFGQTKQECKDMCVSGCQCPEGYVFNYSNQCVPVEQCQCLFNGKFYKAESSRIFDCNVCECHKGSWFCSENNCEESAECGQNQLYRVVFLNIVFQGKIRSFLGRKT